MVPQALILCLLVLAKGSLAKIKDVSKIKNVMLFGDSYTDQSRQHSIENGSFPGKDYQEVFPPADTAADGGVQWPWYLGLYGNLTIWNYAVGGAVCSNNVTPLNGFPDVIGGQAAWFVQDHVLNATENSPQTLDIPPSEFVVDIFIGTNDVGVNNFITDGQAFNVSLKSLATCQLQSIRNLHALGARNFILNSLIPLQLTELYSNSSAPNIYWPALHNGTNWHKRAFNFANSLNELLKDGVSNLATEWESEPETSVEFFDTYAFFEEMYNHPAMFFNGSIPANVTGHCHQCPDPDNFLDCGIGDCTLAQRDSYMWWDELHPSEQTGRNLAAEIWRKIQGVSKF